MKFKDVLTNKKVALKLRLKFFDSIVTCTVLYGCQCWTMTQAQQTQLRTARRRMLRWIVATRRSPEETWVEYVKRATTIAEKQAADSKLSEWTTLHNIRKLEFAALMSLRNDGRWTERLLRWTPWFKAFPRRSQGRPALR